MMSSEYVSIPTTNDGQVKMNDGNGIVAGWRFGDVESINGQWQTIKYAAPLGLSAFPTTSWPRNIATPTDADTYDFVNNTFLENPVPGQTHTWRIVIEYVKSAGPNTDLFFELRNTLSGFSLEQYILAQKEQLPFMDLIEFVTIADAASLPPPYGTGQGYEIRVQASNNLLQEEAGDYLLMTSITRVSEHFTRR